MHKMMNTGKMSLCLVLVVLGLTLWGCYQKGAEQKESSKPAAEAPAMGTTEEGGSMGNEQMKEGGEMKEGEKPMNEENKGD
jgi:hypothetical protein